MIHPPSLQHPFALVWSEDPALAVPERGPTETESSWKITMDDWTGRLNIARDFGQWDTVLKAGATPTLFKVRPMPGTLMRKLHDAINAGVIGPMSASAWAVRICLQSIENFGGYEVKFEQDERFGKVAAAAVIDHLDAIDPGIVLELGMVLNARAWSPPGK